MKDTESTQAIPLLPPVWNTIVSRKKSAACSVAVNRWRRCSQRKKQDAFSRPFGRDLTQMAREGKLDPVIGREKE